ncbi:MAG: enoyl-CoA hydratase-related protein [Aestuariivirga sp.]
MAGYETLLVENHGTVLLIQLNRPQALNAINGTLTRELLLVLNEFGADANLRCAVITGSEKAFAAGADVKDMTDKTFANMLAENYFAEFDQISRIRKPIIAAVAGFALGGGCELAMMCDFVIAAESAKFGQPEITLGAAPGMGGSQRLTRLVGKSKAMDMVLTGRMMDATEAERAGIVSRIVPAAKLVEEALGIARKIAEMAPLAVLANKEMVNAALETSLAQGILFERRLFHSLFALDDRKEGMTAFIEKRKPVFTGK